MRLHPIFLAVFLALLWTAAAHAGGTVRIAQLIVGPGSEPRPTALRRLAWEVDKRTSIEIATEPVRVTLGDAALFEYPLLYLAGDRAFSLPAQKDLARLGRHLAYGGMLLIDNAEARPGGGFDHSARELSARLFPRATLKPASREHVVYKSFFLLSEAVGRARVSPDLEVIEQDGRLVVVYTQNDLGGAWARDSLGRWEYEVTPGGEAQRERAFRLGINLVMYALCLDYKDDQVHVPFLLKRRQWKVAP